MNKEDILARSRKENKNQDEYEKEVIKSASNIALMVTVITATVLFVLQIILSGGVNYGLYAVVFTTLATEFIIKSVKLKMKHEILVAVLYSIAAICFTAAFIIGLVM